MDCAVFLHVGPTPEVSFPSGSSLRRHRRKGTLWHSSARGVGLPRFAAEEMKAGAW